uniref:Uncharacterized protein n=1 Tax=Tanacetum cinerariifolium TaxID=118510 RepID=A0A699GUG9_TANCI|nr:hypothetical protein [Tanacetum cinerariifolium]
MEEREIHKDDVHALKVNGSVKDLSVEVIELARKGENQNARKVSNCALRDGVHRASRIKKAQEKDKIGSKPDKNEKRGEAGKSLK